MALLAKQTITVAGLAPAYTAATGGGDTVQAGPSVFLHVKNASGGAITVTVDDPNTATPAGAKQFDPDLGVSVPAGGERMIGPITDRFTNAASGVAAITYSGVTSLTIAALQV